MKKVLSTALLLGGSLATLSAQDPGDPNPVPIDDYVGLLAFVAVALAVVAVRIKRKLA